MNWRDKGYVSLWRAVIWRAAMDAFGVGLSSGGHRADNRYGRLAIRNQARRWFERPSIDFIRVCDWAELDHNWVRKGVLELLDKFGDGGFSKEATLRNRLEKYLN